MIHGMPYTFTSQSYTGALGSCSRRCQVAWASAYCIFVFLATFSVDVCMRRRAEILYKIGRV